MTNNKSVELRSQVIYSIYVRNHTEEGTFNAVIPDLDRIKALGTDIIWFMPIHPIGVKGKKGTLGCPYANRDYRSVNPEYGTLDDFKHLVDEIHKRDMKCIIDVVYNHTSPDAVLVDEHPEFYYRKPDGSFGGKTADWSDVIDLDYDCNELWDYQVETLSFWASIVDGFRCDVASVIPVKFWQRARDACAKINPECIWLGETVHNTFQLYRRIMGVCIWNDNEMFEAFDMEYDYDIREVFDDYLAKKAKLSHYMNALNFQEYAYPISYNKMRCLENHDQPRIASYTESEKELLNYTAMLYFLKGITLIYAGQEYANLHTPSLFDKEVIDRNTSVDLSSYLAKMNSLKKNILSVDDYIVHMADDENDIAIIYRIGKEKKAVGIFSLKGKECDVNITIPRVENLVADGTYINEIDGNTITCISNTVHCNGNPIIFTSENDLV